MLRTPLFAAHQRHNARLTEFAGWEMPLFYAGTTAEHNTVRSAAGVFDLSHMGRFEVSGPHAVTLLEAVTPSAFSHLSEGAAQYTMVLNEKGGTVDDVIVTRHAEDRFHVCVNAVNREAVLTLLQGSAEGAVVTDHTFDTGQIAVQGPDTPQVISGILGEAPFPAFMHAQPVVWEGHPLTVSRTGYTGELGVELFAPVAALEPLWAHLTERAEPCGLGARDTLRLEMGYPLYGHELTAEVTPVAAGFGWVVDWERESLPAREALLRDRDKPERHICGIWLTQPGIPREGCPVWVDGEVRGVISSGNMGISVGCGIGMAWLPREYAEPGTDVSVEVRNRRLSGQIGPLPFYNDGTVRKKVA